VTRRDTNGSDVPTVTDAMGRSVRRPSDERRLDSTRNVLRTEVVISIRDVCKIVSRIEIYRVWTLLYI